MKEKLAVYLNNFGTSSEVFLIQLFLGLSKEFDITLYVRGKIFQDSPWLSKFKVEQIPSRKSLGFLLFCLRTPTVFFRRSQLRKTYFRYRLAFMNSKKIYYPFISMPLDYEEFPELFDGLEIYTSIRGTDITVTPVFNASVVEKYQRLAPSFKGIHFLSEDLQMLGHSMSIKNENERIIYQGVDLSKWTRTQELISDSLKLVTVGRLHYIKGLEYLLLVGNELKKRNVAFELNIIGDGPEREKLEYLIDRLDLTGKVHLLGRKSHDEIVQIFNNSNVYVHSHLVNGISNTMLEAMAMDLKVVTFNSNFEAYENPIYAKEITQIKDFDVVEYARSLEDILKTNSFGVSEELMNDVRLEFGFETHAKKFASFFKT